MNVSPSLRLVAVGVCTLVAAAVFAGFASAVNFGPTFAFHYLQPPCCNGSPVNGTRASIRVTNVTPPSQWCLAFRSDAENQNSSWLIQAGMIKCGLASGGADGTCSLSDNLVFFVEVESGVNNYACFPHGQATENSGA